MSLKSLEQNYKKKIKEEETKINKALKALLILSFVFFGAFAIYKANPNKVRIAKGIVPDIFKQFREGIKPTNTKNLNTYEFNTKQ